MVHTHLGRPGARSVTHAKVTHDPLQRKRSHRFERTLFGKQVARAE